MVGSGDLLWMHWDALRGCAGHQNATIQRTADGERQIAQPGDRRLQ